MWGWEGHRVVWEPQSSRPTSSGPSGNFNGKTPLKQHRLWAGSCDWRFTMNVHRRNLKRRGVCVCVTDKVKAKLHIACSGSWWHTWGSPPPGQSGRPTGCHTISKDMHLPCAFVSPLAMKVLTNGASNSPVTRMFSDFYSGG